MGDRAGSLPNYATINGKVSSSPIANGMSSPSGSSTVSFSHTLPDFSKYSMPGVSLLSLPAQDVRTSALAIPWQINLGGSLTSRPESLACRRGCIFKTWLEWGCCDEGVQDEEGEWHAAVCMDITVVASY